jgi:ribonuclease BN (tRNA processing enzyme)
MKKSMDIKVVALGTGAAFTSKNQTNLIVEIPVVENGVKKIRNLLVDGGSTLRSSLPEAGYSEKDITDIYVTHHHSDHDGGIEEFAQKALYIFKNKANLYILEDRYHDFIDRFKGGLHNQGNTLETFFNVHLIPVNEPLFYIGDVMFEIIPTDNLHCREMKSTAINITRDGQNILYTSDIKHLEESNLLDYVTENTVAIFQDASIQVNFVHADVEQVKKFYNGHIDFKNIHIVHYQDDVSPDDCTKTYSVTFTEARKVYTF